MKAIVYIHYGPSEVLKIKDIIEPIANDNQVLIKTYATTVNRTDCATIKAKPFFMRVVTGLFRPKKQTPGTEFSGTIEAIGKNISDINVGDRVFGLDDQCAMSHAEYLIIEQDKLVTIPQGISFEQAAASSEGTHYAYNFINKLNLQKGQKVLVNGATGGIGSAAVQLLNYFEVKVVATCAGKNAELVKALGADRVIDYTKDDFTQDADKYDCVFDTVGKSSFFKCKKLLKPGGVYISSDLGFMAQNLFLPLLTPLLGPFLQRKKTIFPMPVDVKGSLHLIRDLMEQGKFNAVIDRIYSFEEIIDAYKYVEKGHKKGNVVINVCSD